MCDQLVVAPANILVQQELALAIGIKELTTSINQLTMYAVRVAWVAHMHGVVRELTLFSHFMFMK